MNEELSSFLTKLSDQVKIRCTVNEEDIDRAMSLTREEMVGMDARHLQYYGYTLGKYALQLQKETNRLTSTKLWAEDKITGMVAKEIDQYKDSYLKYDVKVKKIIQNDAAATKLWDIAFQAGVLLAELDYMSRHVNTIANMLINTKRIREEIDYRT